MKVIFEYFGCSPVLLDNVEFIEFRKPNEVMVIFTKEDGELRQHNVSVSILRYISIAK